MCFHLPVLFSAVFIPALSNSNVVMFLKDGVASISEKLVSIQTNEFSTDFWPSALAITDIAVCFVVAIVSTASSFQQEPDHNSVA